MNSRTKKERAELTQKAFALILVLSIMVITIFLTISITKEKEDGLSTQTFIGTVEEKKEIKEEVKSISKEISKEKFKAKSVITKPTYNITLSEYLQDFTYQATKLCPDVDYTLALAVLYSESKYNEKAKNVNRNGSVDRGIAQINSEYTDHYAEISQYEQDFDPYIAEHGIRACVYKLQTLADVWKKNGITDKETLELYMIQSYNRGVIGFKSYMKEYGTPYSDYSNKVLLRKQELLTKGEIITK